MLAQVYSLKHDNISNQWQSSHCCLHRKSEEDRFPNCQCLLFAELDLSYIFAQCLIGIYLQEHLFLVCELLRANLYEFQKYNRENGDEPYFTLPHLQRIAQQVTLPPSQMILGPACCLSIHSSDF